MISNERMDGLESRVALLERRMHALGAPAAAAPERPAGLRRPVADTPERPAVPRSRDPWPLPLPPPTAPAPRAARPDAAKLEELLGGRVLAWVGAVAVLVGIFFLLVIAVSRGWIGEAERTLMAGLASLGLLAAGAWLHEARGRTDAALAAAATGIAGLFGTLAVAGAVYELVPAVAALLGALAVGAAATALALRWETPGIGALGIVGALLAPALVGAQPSDEGVALLAVATASATAVLVWQRWNWLAFAAFAIATPQWLLWIGFDEPGAATTVAALVVFGLLAAAAAVGFELRARSPRLRTSSAVLLVLNALVLACAGWLALSAVASDGAGHLWLAGLAAAHLAAGLAGARLKRVSHELSLAALALGVVLADVAFASVVDGLPVLLGFVASGVGFAGLLRGGTRGRGDEPFAAAGLGGHLLLALGHALVLAAPPDAIAGGYPGAGALLALAGVAAGCAVSSNLVAERHPRLPAVLDSLGLAVLGYLTVVALDGPALTFALTAEAVVLAVLARREGSGPVALPGALAYLAAALGHAVGVLAPPAALVTGVGDPLAAAVALGSVALGAAVLAAVAPDAGRLRGSLAGGAALVVLYLASVELVTPFQPGAEGLAIGELGVRQQGQALLSALWALTGFGALVGGLLADRPALRRGALALLLITVAKVFLYDLASLTSIYRVASFIVLGLLLLGGAFAWQRVRPRPLPDLRGMPEGLR